MELVDKETEMVPDKKRGFLALFDLKHVWEGVAAVFKWRPNHKRTFLIAMIIIFEMEMFVIVGISLNFLMDKLLLLGKRNNSLFRAKYSFCLHKFLCSSMFALFVSKTSAKVRELLRESAKYVCIGFPNLMFLKTN